MMLDQGNNINAYWKSQSRDPDFRPLAIQHTLEGATDTYLRERLKIFSGQLEVWTIHIVENPWEREPEGEKYENSRSKRVWRTLCTRTHVHYTLTAKSLGKLVVKLWNQTKWRDNINIFTLLTLLTLACHLKSHEHYTTRLSIQTCDRVQLLLYHLEAWILSYSTTSLPTDLVGRDS